MDHFPNQLSGGEQQRVTIARAIANNPAILLLDEPTGDLDTTSTDVVMKILIDLNRKHGITMVMVTHDVGLKNFADRVVHMSDGKIHRVAPVKREDREQIVKQLEERIDIINANIASGGNRQNLNIREGITEQNSGKEEEHEKRAIPANFAAILDGNATSKTTIRRPQDYPVLKSRFEQKEIRINSF
jgi:putative ABC transport system ATP-binding protein